VIVLATDPVTLFDADSMTVFDQPALARKLLPLHLAARQSAQRRTAPRTQLDAAGWALLVPLSLSQCSLTSLVGCRNPRGNGKDIVRDASRSAVQD
jgi:hypothetical protein